MKITVVCECCGQRTSEESDKIKSTYLNEYIGTGGDSFKGFICNNCKQAIDNAAFAEFKRIKNSSTVK